MPRMRQALRSLGIVLSIVGVLMLGSCASTDGQATAEDVNNQSFTFLNGAVFHPALAGVATVLQFADNATAFTLSATTGTASGTNHFGSCILSVTDSTYSAGTGPQVNDVITLSPCTFDSTNRVLVVSNGANTATSNPAIARVVQATANDLNDRSFLFTSGAIFHPALAGLLVTIQFTNSAAAFSFTDANSLGTASGSFSFGPCTLIFTASTYAINTGPQVNDILKLTTCQFNSGNGLFVISNGSITISSI